MMIQAGPLLTSLLPVEEEMGRLGGMPDLAIFAILLAGFFLSLLLSWRSR